MSNPTVDMTHNARPPFALADRRPRIAPSLLAADFAGLKVELDRIRHAGAEVLHLDVMDGHFVPNISFGPPVIRAVRAATDLYLDTHLMIEEPVRYAEAFVEAGCDLLTFHIEVTQSPRDVVKHLRALGVDVGVSINPTTPVSAISAIIDDVDLVLVMSVWPGFGGQSFMPEVLPKVTELRGMLDDAQRLEIDGGIDGSTISAAADAGADLFVAGTAVFRAADPAEAWRSLDQAVGGARG